MATTIGRYISCPTRTVGFAASAGSRRGGGAKKKTRGEGGSRGGSYTHNVVPPYATRISAHFFLPSPVMLLCPAFLVSVRISATPPLGYELSYLRYMYGILTSSPFSQKREGEKSRLPHIPYSSCHVIQECKKRRPPPPKTKT